MPFSRFVPSYLLSELRHVHFFHGYNTRSRDLLHPPFTKTAKYQESFIINGTQTFNTLSRNFRQVDFRQVGILDNFLRSSPRLNMAATMLNAICCFLFFTTFFNHCCFRTLGRSPQDRRNDVLFHSSRVCYLLTFMVHLLLQLVWSYSRELFNPTDFTSLSTNGLSTAKHA